jgi:adenine-specific DNA methylase
MDAVLYAISIRGSNRSRSFRLPTAEESAAINAASGALATNRAEWEASGFIPDDEVPDGNKTGEPIRFGMTRWSDFFSDRQLLVHATFAREFAALIDEVRSAEGGIADDILFALALMQGKALNYNSRLTTWHTGRQVTRGVFDSHNLAFKWTYAEFDGCHALYPWALEQLLFSYGGIARLLEETGAVSLGDTKPIERPVRVTQGSAADLSTVDTGSIAHLCMDPPYYDNVMYAELADFFYVWERRTLGRLAPEYFRGYLSDKDNEAVANAARFSAMGKRKKELADLDYESKMTGIFSEACRVLRNDGVLSVMFTHKRAEAWDTLGMSLLQAGFTIETSWPVNTEAETSLHQKNMNSAASTIMLVCRKRADRDSDRKIYLDDIEQDIRQAARDAATRFQHDGIEGVDLLLSTYGPTLSVISQSWPVYSSTPDADGRDRLLRPEDALALAREEIVDLRRTRLVGKAAKVDALTDFVLLAWDTFAAREFPFDTARLLALAVGGLDVDALERAKIVSKEKGSVRLLTPKERLRRGADSDLPGVTPETSGFESMIDAVDTALYVAEVDGQQAAKRFLDRHGYTDNSAFISTLQGLVNAIPRTTVKGAWVVPEAGLLDTLCTLYFEDVTLPEATEMATVADPDENALFGVD